MIIRYLHEIFNFFACYYNFTTRFVLFPLKMKTAKTVREIQDLINDSKPGLTGLVPTMGALHRGHVSLVKSAVIRCSAVVVSIYVNPAQFNDREDLRNYPRNIDSDLKLLRETLRENDIVFIPDDNEIYPFPDNREFDFGNAGKVMEALHRPGHFNGVGRVVTRLFDIVKPDVAFFGLKDFQQVAIIRELVRQFNYSIRIEVNPIIRETDGLAMSSRNKLLEPEMRKKAPAIFRTLTEASGMLPDRDIPEIRKFVTDSLEKEAGLKVEYFEIVDDRELIPVTKKSELKKKNRYFGCIAVKAGKIRLIDNIEFTLPRIKKG